jgi:hypothetical protein
VKEFKNKHTSFVPPEKPHVGLLGSGGTLQKKEREKKKEKKRKKLMRWKGMIVNLTCNHEAWKEDRTLPTLVTD